MKNYNARTKEGNENINKALDNAMRFCVGLLFGLIIAGVVLPGLVPA